MRTFRWIVGLVFLLGACTSGEVIVPTIQQFPTLTATAESQADNSSVFSNLPPTFTPTDTLTPAPTFTGTLAPTVIPTITVTPSATITDTPTPTWTPPPPVNPENRPFLALLLTEAVHATILPTDFVVPPHQGINVTVMPEQTQLPEGVPTGIPPLEAMTVSPTAAQITQTQAAVICPNNPAGGFGGVFSSNPNIANQLGCPVGTVQDVPAAWQSFQQGVMVWLNGEILVLYHAGQFQTFPDTFVEGVDPQTSSETPPQGLFTPIRGFLKVWSNNPSVRTGLGWALNQEQGVTAKVQSFANGRMIWLPGRGDIMALLPNGVWQPFGGTF